MLGKVLALSSLSAFVLLSALMQSTSPSTIHPVVILLVFILIYVLALGVLAFLIYGIGRIVHARHAKNQAAKPFTITRAYYFASVLALAPVMLIGARSVGRTGFVDILLIMLFEALACFYIAKRS
ncbi:MAG: hypothetical protein WBO49_04495 [Candidatus Saccharimonas sp.]